MEGNDLEMTEIQKLIEELEYHTAKDRLEKKLTTNPNDVEVIDTLSEVLIDLGEVESAIKLIKKSISLEPNKNADKYMTLGQLSENCKISLKNYEKGIQIFVSELENEKDINKALMIKNSLASAYAAVAELYMNTDLCNEENAENMCESCLSEALKFNSDSFDALIQISNLRILRKRDDEALGYMEKIYTFIMDCIDNNMENNLPSQDIILNLSKNYAELAQYTKAIKLLDILIKLNDEDLECWYLLAFNHYTIKNFKHSFKCLKQFKKISNMTSYKSDDVLELEEAAGELEIALEDIRKQNHNGELRNNILEESEEGNDEEERSMNDGDEMRLD